MKKNLVLLIILVGLGVFTYFFEELGSIKSREEERKRSQLIDTSQYGELLELKTKNAHLIFEGNRVYALKDKVPCSNEKVNKFFELISSLRIVENIDLEKVKEIGETNFFKDKEHRLEFKFEKNQLSFIVGEKLQFDETFYIQYKDSNNIKYFVVKDSAPREGVYSKENEHNSELSYLKFKNLIYVNDSYFYDTRIFKDDFYSRYNKKKIFKSIEVLSKRNRAYTIDLDRLKTNPVPFKTINYDEKEFSTFKDYLLKLEAKNMFVGYSKKLLKNLLSQIKIKDSFDQPIVLSLYSNYGRLNGAFLTSSLDDNLYELHSFDKGLFFQNVQDFWDLMVPLEVFNGPFQFELGDSQLELNIVQDKKFKVVNLTNTKEPIHQRFKTLLDILNIRANYITKSSGQLKLPSHYLKFKNTNHELIFFFENNEIVVIDLQSKLKYHYSFAGADKISMQSSDYFLDL